MSDKVQKLREELKFIDNLEELQDFFLNFNYTDTRDLVCLLSGVLKTCSTFRQEICNSLHEEIRFREQAIEEKLK